MDITSNELGDKLFIGISDGNKKSLLSEIEIYDLGNDAKDFQFYQRITLQEIFQALQLRLNAPNLIKNLEKHKSLVVSKLDFKNGELMILFSNCLMVFVQLINEYNDYQPKFRVTEVITPQMENLLQQQDMMFDEDYIPDRLDEYYPWKPLIAKPLYSQQNVDPLED